VLYWPARARGSPYRDIPSMSLSAGD